MEKGKRIRGKLKKYMLVYGMEPANWQLEQSYGNNRYLISHRDTNVYCEIDMAEQMKVMLK